MHRLAHTLKGSAALLSASRVRECASRLERLAPGESWESAHALFLELEAASQELLDTLAREC